VKGAHEEVTNRTGAKWCAVGAVYSIEQFLI
jgi:hypothetical protein